MKRVAVLGGGPAGAVAAARLAAAGVETVIFDEKLAWEKPCGGGITFKAYDKYPFLINNNTPKRVVTETMIAAPETGSASLQLTKPLLVYARRDLNQMLLDRAAHAGANIEQARVLGMDRQGAGWRLRTAKTELDVDFCVVATGARNPLRNVGTQFTAEDSMTALGYFVPCDQAHIDIQFLPDLEGYIWVFPRCGHLSVGICGKGFNAQTLRKMLERYMAEKGLSIKEATFYGHMLPSLEKPNWKANRLQGEGWAAVGDAGGLVDPITGEGIYYAVRSGDLAAELLLERKEATYASVLREDFIADLEFGAALAKRVYTGKFLFKSAPQRMVQFMRRSPRFLSLMQDLFAGTQNYIDLKDCLLRKFNGTLHEIMLNTFLRQMVTG